MTLPHRPIVTSELPVGIALVALGLLIDHTAGVVAAAVGFVLVTVALSTVADRIGRRLLHLGRKHLSFRRWSG